MPWFRVDDDLAFHRKTVAAGNAAMGMWVRAGSWCAQTLTDGFVPAHMIAALGNNAQARKLVLVGLWTAEKDGYRFHEWAGRQPTRVEVDEKRAAARDRMRRVRTGNKDDGSEQVRANETRTDIKGSSERSSEVRLEQDPSYDKISTKSDRNLIDLYQSVTESDDSTDETIPQVDDESELDVRENFGRSDANPVPVPVPVPISGHLGGKRYVSNAADSQNPPPKFHPEHPDAYEPGCADCERVGRRHERHLALALAHTEPSPYCDRHPSGTTNPCRDCHRARELNSQWLTDRRHAEALRRSETARRAAEDAARAIGTCRMCDDEGRIEGWVCHHDPARMPKPGRAAEAARQALCRLCDAGGHRPDGSDCDHRTPTTESITTEPRTHV